MREYLAILLILTLLFLSAHAQETSANYLAKANELNNKGEYNESIPFYDKAISKDPNSAEAWNGKGLALQNMSKYYESIPCFDKAVQINPSYKEALYNWAYTNIMLNRYDEAEKLDKRAVEIDPHYCNAINDLGLIQYEQRNFDAALQYYDQVLSICQNMAVTWVNKALAYDEMGDKDKAVEAYEKAKAMGFEGSSECEKRFGAFLK